MLKARRLLMLFVVLLSLQAATAFAAPAEWKSVDVTLQTEQQQSLMLVSGELPAEVKLPAEAELAVPAGAQLQWIGEVLGGDPAQDPQVQYKKSSSGAMDVYTFTLTKARFAQVEAVIPSATSVNGTTNQTALKWTAWRDLPEVRISQRLPQTAQIQQPAAGATMRPGPQGYTDYTKTVTAPKAGDTVELSFSYGIGAAAPTNTSASGTSGNDTVVLVLVLLVAVGAFGLLLVKVNQKAVAKAAASQGVAVEPAQYVRDTEASGSPKSGNSKGKASAAPVVEQPVRRKINPIVPMFVVIGVFVVGFVIAGTKGTSATVLDGKISRNFGAASACQSTSVPFTVVAGADIAKQGDKVLEGLEGMEGVGVVTIDTVQSKIDMGWCESSQSEESMRQALTKSGLIVLGPSAATPSAPASTTVDAPVE